MAGGESAGIFLTADLPRDCWNSITRGCEARRFDRKKTALRRGGSTQNKQPRRFRCDAESLPQKLAKAPLRLKKKLPEYPRRDSLHCTPRTRFATNRRPACR